MTIATNATALDASRLRLVLPHWLRVFGDRFSELLVVIDDKPPEGRIAALHGAGGSLDDVRNLVAEFASVDRRVRAVDLPKGDRLDEILAAWFGHERPIRCRAGTPVAAFVAAIELAHHDTVLRADCDMLFHDSGWLEAGFESLHAQGTHVVEPHRLAADPDTAISTRVMLTRRENLRISLLPMRAHRVDPLRQLHALLNGATPWLALEQMLEVERRQGRLRYLRLPRQLGFWLHVARRADAELPVMQDVVTAMEADTLPAAQLHSFDFVADAWARSVA